MCEWVCKWVSTRPLQSYTSHLSVVSLPHSLVYIEAVPLHKRGRCFVHVSSNHEASGDVQILWSRCQWQGWSQGKEEEEIKPKRGSLIQPSIQVISAVYRFIPLHQFPIVILAVFGFCFVESCEWITNFPFPLHINRQTQYNSLGLVSVSWYRLNESLILHSLFTFLPWQRHTVYRIIYAWFIVVIFNLSSTQWLSKAFTSTVDKGDKISEPACTIYETICFLRSYQMAWFGMRTKVQL